MFQVDPSKKVWRFDYSLLLRIMSGINDEAKSLLRELEIPRDIVDRKGKTLLHYALKYRNTEMLQHLIDIGHDVEVPDSDGFTLLMLAAESDDLTALGVLLKCNVDIYCIQRHGMSFAQVAIYRRLFQSKITCLKQIEHSTFELFIERINNDFLTNNKREIITSQLSNADDYVKLAIVASANQDLAKFILENNYPIDYYLPENKLTALHWAIIFGKFENAKLLLEHGANVNLLDSTRNSSLDYYVDHFERVDEQSEVLKMLLKVTRNREYYLQHLLVKGNEATVKALLESYVDVVSMKFYGNTSLLHLLMSNEKFDDLDFFAELITKIDLNLPSYSGRPLIYAVRSGCPKKVEFLLRNGAYVNWVCIFDACKIYFSSDSFVRRTLVKIVELSLQYGADIQFVVDGDKTIFNEMESTPKAKLLASTFIAHFALIEALDHVYLIDRIRHQIKSDPKFKSKFDSCLREIEELKGIKVYGSITLWNVLAEKVEKVAFYARNQEFLLAFDCTMKKVTHMQSYYRNTLQKKVIRALDRIELDKKAAAIVEILTGLCRDVYHVIVYKIIRYLNSRDLKNLCKVVNIIFAVA